MAQQSKTPVDTSDASAPMVIQCGCGMHDDEEGDASRKAVAVDPEAKARNVRRLRLIEGQVRGLQKMVEEERYCADVLTQVSSVQEALRGVSRSLLQNHLKHCATEAIRSDDPERSEAMYDELLELVFRSSR